MSKVQIVFDPLHQVIAAYEALYDKPCLVQFFPFDENDQQAWGFTEFPEDASERPVTSINTECPIMVAVEVLAHELAHVAVFSGCDDEHGSDWQAAFSAIHDKYTEMVMDNVPEGMEVVIS